MKAKRRARRVSSVMSRGRVESVGAVVDEVVVWRRCCEWRVECSWAE